MLNLDKNKRYNLENLSDNQIKVVEKIMEDSLDYKAKVTITEKATLYFDKFLNEWNVRSDYNYTCDALELFLNIPKYKFDTPSFEGLIKFNKEFSEILKQPGYIMNNEDEAKIELILKESEKEVKKRESERFSKKLFDEIKVNVINPNPLFGITSDKVVQSVMNDLNERSKVGVGKYGVTLEREDLNLKEWLQHAYEETLDKANYLKRAILEIEG